MLILICGIFIGAIAGLLSGLFGIGGGIIMVPLINALLIYQGYPAEHTMHFAVGTTLATMIFSTASSSYFHFRKGPILWQYVFYIAPFMVLGSFLGVGVADHFSTQILKGIFSLFCAAIALHFFQKTTTKHPPKPFPPAHLGFSVLGFGIGICAGLAGIGGGILLIPILVRLGGPLKQIGPVSAICSLPTVSMATLSAIYFGQDLSYSLDMPHWGYVLWNLALVQGIFSVLSAYFGVQLAHHLETYWLRRILACLLLLIAGLMFPWK